MTKFVELWRNQVQNAEIAASGKQIFGTATSDQQNRRKYGSANFLFLSNRSSYPVQIELDGQLYTEVYPQASLIIEANDGTFFDLLTVENLDSGNAIAVSLITIRYGRAEEV